LGTSVVAEASGDRIYVVGDLHGCLEEPEILIKHLESREGLSQDDLVIFLGDYVDRGPDTKSVVDLMLDFATRFPKTRYLKGNHEDMLLDFLGFDGRMGQAFLYNGGLETIQSYGISVFSPPGEMVDAMPESHFQFYSELESIIQVGDFICVHAGLNPTKELGDQDDSEVFWIRDEFIANDHNFGKTIVFGHTPHQEVFEHLPYKIGIDTGLVFGNKLTCLELKEGKLLQVTRGETDVEEDSVDIEQTFVGGEEATT